MRSTALSLMAAALLVSACDTGTGPGGTVAIRFATAPGLAPAAVGGSLYAAASSGTQQGLEIDGDNGRLEITRIAVIVEEFELEPVDVGDCDDVEPEPAECEDFEVKFFFIDVPLSGEITVLNQQVPEGFFEELEVEIDELEVDDDDLDDLANAQKIQDLLNDIRNNRGFPNWPARASMAVVGTFTPKDANGNLLTNDVRSFTTFIRAEVEVELEPPTPFEVTDGNAVSILVNVRPDLWFRVGNNVLDLSQFQNVNNLLKLDVEIENGFEIEIDT